MESNENEIRRGEDSKEPPADPVEESDSANRAGTILMENPEPVPDSQKCCVLRSQWEPFGWFKITRADAASVVLLIIAWYIIAFIAMV